MSRISGDLGVMETTVNDLETSLRDFEKALDHLDKQVSAHLKEWVGDARDAYNLDHAAWMASATELHAQLTWLQQVVSNAGHNFGNALHTTLTMWQGHE